MAMGFSGDNGSQVYLELVKHAIAGDKVSPRGQATRELRNVTVVLRKPENAVPVAAGRKLKTEIGVVETLHLVAGISSVTQLNAASGNRFSAYANHGRLLGAYGPRVYVRLREIVKILAQDPDSRQAQVPIFQPGDAKPDRVQGQPQLDVPCTLSLGFMVRYGALNMTTRMRSNDLWLGYPYDVWMFTRLQLVMAWALGIPVGEYVHQVDSLHLYERDLDRAIMLAPDRRGAQPPSLVRADGTFGADVSWPTKRDRFASAQYHAQAILLGKGSVSAQRLGWEGAFRYGDEWYRSHLPLDFRTDERLCPSCRYAFPRSQPNRFGSSDYCRQCWQLGRAGNPMDVMIGE